jgi:hypothetical protein
MGYLIAVAVCCREWPVFAWLPIGRCGYCGERPVLREG